MLHSLSNLPGITRNYCFCLMAETCHLLGDADRAAPIYEQLRPHADRAVVATMAALCLGSVSRHLGILASQQNYPPYTSAEFLSAVLPLLEYTTFLPNSPFWSRWSEAYYLGIQAVESGDLTADEALEVVVDQLQNELGDKVVIQ